MEKQPNKTNPNAIRSEIKSIKGVDQNLSCSFFDFFPEQSGVGS